MPGPYYNDWTGPSWQHPSNEAKREEIEGIQTAEDAVRLFPDDPLPESITVQQSPRDHAARRSSRTRWKSDGCTFSI